MPRYNGPSSDLHFAITGDDSDVLAMLGALDSCFSVQGMTDFMFSDAAPWLRERAQRRFENEGDDAVGMWAPLKPVTQDIRRWGIQAGHWSGIAPDHPINQRSHAMYDYIVRGRGEMVFSPGRSAFYFPGRSAPTKLGMDKKVRRAQLGDGGKTPKRPVLGIGQVDAMEIITQLSYFVVNRVSGRKVI